MNCLQGGEGKIARIPREERTWGAHPSSQKGDPCSSCGPASPPGYFQRHSWASKGHGFESEPQGWDENSSLAAGGRNVFNFYLISIVKNLKLNYVWFCRFKVYPLYNCLSNQIVILCGYIK